MKLLEKGSDFASVQRTLNQPEHRQVFEEFCHRMNCKLHFHNDFSEMYSEIPGFRPKSSCFSPRDMLVKKFFKPIRKRTFYR